MAMLHPVDIASSELARLAAVQHGALSRGQARALGVTDEVITSNVTTCRWQRPFPGIYVTFTGPLPYTTRVWAALLYASRGNRAGEGAMVSHETAAYLQGLRESPPTQVHLTVAGRRRVRAQPGVAIHRSAVTSGRRHPVRVPPQTRVEDTVLDLIDQATHVDTVVALLSGACQRRLTTAARLSAAAARRRRCRWRRLCEEVLTDVAEGVQSALERRYYRDVERAHGLPRAERNRPEDSSGRRNYRDVRYRKFRTLVELDGSAAHPPEQRGADQARDNDVVEAEEAAPLRYGWIPIAATPCRVAGQVARVLQQRGWEDQPRPCGPGCGLR
ncbi:hypothetical protein BH24ACT13_BH24ACT13_09640 [soil metagenome]|jgi:predicted transcriptional regulator of viral defense system